MTRRLLTAYQYPLDVQQLSGSCEDTEIEFARLYADAIGICSISIAKVTPPVYCYKATWSTDTICNEETPGLNVRYVDKCCVEESVCLEEILHQWLAVFEFAAGLWSWGFDDYLAPDPDGLVAEQTKKLIDFVIEQGLSTAESVNEHVFSGFEAAIMAPFAKSKLAFRNVMKHQEADLLMEIAQGYLDAGLSKGGAYERWNVYPAVTRETILATACRQMAGNSLRVDEDMVKLRRAFKASADALNEPDPTYGLNVPACLELHEDAPHDVQVSCAKQIMETASFVDPTGVVALVNAFTYETCPNINDPNDSTYSPRTYLRDDHPWHRIKGQLQLQLYGKNYPPEQVHDRGDGDSILTQLKAAMLPQECVQYVKGVCRPMKNYNNEAGQEYALMNFPSRSLIALGNAEQPSDFCCPVGFKEIETEAECRAAYEATKKGWVQYGDSVHSSTRAFGCLLDIETDTVQFNSNRNFNEARGLDEFLCVRGGDNREGWSVGREIRGYHMGRPGMKCPPITNVKFQSDCLYALRQFTDNADVPLDTFSQRNDLPPGCSYNTDTHRGQWNVLYDWQGAGSGQIYVEPICYNPDDVTKTIRDENHCYYSERRMWDTFCCMINMAACPAGYQEVGIGVGENNNIFYHRYFRLCSKTTCECPPDTREFEEVTEDNRENSFSCISFADFGSQTSSNCFTEGHDTVSRDEQCPGNMYCDVDTQQCKRQLMLNVARKNGAFNQLRGGLCTCPNGQVYGVGIGVDEELHCHGGIASDVMNVPAGWAQGAVDCASCTGPRASVACGKLNNGMGMFYEGSEAWMGVPSGEQGATRASASFKFHCSEDVSEFRFRSLTRAPNGRANSFYLVLDGGQSITWHLGIGQPQWESPSLGSVAAGTHSISVIDREPGAFLSKLIMLNDACEFEIDNTREDDRQEFALAPATPCGGSRIGADWTLDSNYSGRCAEQCAAHDECAAFQIQKSSSNGVKYERCEFFASPLSLSSYYWGDGCYFKFESVVA